MAGLYSETLRGKPFLGGCGAKPARAGNTEHDTESYGSMAVYRRLKGILPPPASPASSASRCLKGTLGSVGKNLYRLRKTLYYEAHVR